MRIIVLPLADPIERMLLGLVWSGRQAATCAAGTSLRGVRVETTGQGGPAAVISAHDRLRLPYPAEGVGATSATNRNAHRSRQRCAAPRHSRPAMAHRATARDADPVR